ncbi:MAG TPA: dipeptide epimerase [Phycisphaerae bacterium]|nr:dipeptide epimerase [Phycisphaerae bacterium]
MQISWSPILLRLAGSFRTAKATRLDKKTLWVKVTHLNIVGWGEAAPMDTYGQTLESAEKALLAMSGVLSERPFSSIGESIDRLVEGFGDQMATVAAVDAALHDWAGKQAGVPAFQLLGCQPTGPFTTSFTIGLDEPQAVVERVRCAEAYPILKLKLGGPNDEEIVARVRESVPSKTIRVDANTAWTVDHALDMLPRLAKYGVEFVEQPLPAGDIEGLRRLKEAGILPIVADESCVRPDDVPKVAGCVDGINIKLSKCGGIREALKMIRLARAHGLEVMLGCMIESSLGISAALQLAPLADWLDLDGHLLLAHDPFTGIGGAGGRLTLSNRPGLGVESNDLAESRNSI